MRVVRLPWLVATSLTLCVALVGCSASDITTDAGGPTTVAAKTGGTTKAGKPSGFAASLAVASDPRAAAVGALVDIRPPKIDTTTTVVVVDTTPETLPPVVTTAKPIVTVAPTLPPTTPAPTLPPVSIPKGKPIPQPMIGGLSANEQKALDTMNAARAAQGLGQLVPEQHAMSIARQHNTTMAATNQPPYTISANLFEILPVAYQTLGQIEGFYPGAADEWVPILNRQVGSYGQPFVYVGIGINRNSGGGVVYWTIIIGN